MGCMCVKDENKETVSEEIQKKTYKWDEKRKLLDPKNFMIENLEKSERIKLPGSVNGEQFIIQNCKESSIYILDHINTITIDDCINCKVILGAVEGSAFIRNCKSCTLVVACGQFRMRDCNKINVFLYSATQPIIEASSDIHFGTFQLNYKSIQDHFAKANLSSSNANWKVVYDFTPVECEDNWNFMKNDKVSDHISEPKSEEVKNELEKLEFSWNPMENIVKDCLIKEGN